MPRCRSFSAWGDITMTVSRQAGLSLDPGVRGDAA